MSNDNNQRVPFPGQKISFTRPDPFIELDDLLVPVEVDEIHDNPRVMFDDDEYDGDVEELNFDTNDAMEDYRWYMDEMNM